jgi:hypothetical protein
VESYTDGRGYYENEDQMLKQLRVELQKGIEKAGRAPQVLVMGALVRAGCKFLPDTFANILNREDVAAEQWICSRKPVCQMRIS